MFVVREDQIASFQDVEMRAHLKTFAPRLVTVAGEDGVTAAVRIGIEQAGSYGFTHRGPVRFYLELMATFGSDFDSDPQLAWASSILKDQTILGQTARSDRLYAAMTSYFDQVYGPDNAYALDALRRVPGLQLEDFTRNEGPFLEKVLANLRAGFPQKAEFVGEAGLRALVSRGLEIAGEHAISREPWAVLMIALMFVFGHGVAADPFYPWVSSILCDQRVTDPDERARRLLQRTRVYAEHALAYWEARPSAQG
jgi:hypothetical protein